MKKSVAFALGSILLCLLTLLYLHFNVFVPAVRSGVVADKRKAYNATCYITTPTGSRGTGVLLDTGYIITAAHVVDNLHNGLDEWERDVELQFFGDAPMSTKGRVFCSFVDIDIAFIEAENVGKRKGISIAPPAMTGQPVYTIGMTIGGPPMISAGYICAPDETGERSSVFVSRGNSGGALLTEQDSLLVGIVNRVALRSSVMTIIIPTTTTDEDGNMVMTFTRARVQAFDEVNAMASHVDVDKIERFLTGRKISNLLRLPELPGISERFLNKSTALYLLLLGKVLLVVSGAAWTKKNILG